MTVKDSDFAVLKDNVHEMKGDIKELVRVITIGNGKPSMLSRLDAVESKASWVNEILTWMNKTKGGMKVLWAVICLLGMSGIAALIRSFL